MNTRLAMQPMPDGAVGVPPSFRLSATPSSISDALIIAAGRGRRLGGDRPKPLYPLLGVPLLARTLFTLESAGITDAYIVLGYGADEIRQKIDAIDRFTIRLHWLYNDQWERPNGLSVLTAASALDGPFLLAMGDHVFDASAAQRLIEGAHGLEGIDLLIDRAIDRVGDLDEATKVRVESGWIRSIGKSVPRYDAVDTGLFLATPMLFDALRESVAEGRETLSDGVQRLADAGRARAVDGDGATWQDVDTPEDASQAERKLLAALRKDKDGPIARWINRPVSTRISRHVVRTGITPNQVSVATLGVGILSAGAAAVGGFPAWLLSGFLFQLASMLDGVDGEVARLKFRGSVRGEWVDTICDNISYVAFLVGLTLGAARTGLPPLFIWTGVAAVVASILSLANINLYLLQARTSGSARAVRYGYQEPVENPSRFTRFLRVLHIFGKRDMFAVLVLLLAALGQLPLVLPIFGIAATVFLLPTTAKTAVVSAWRSRSMPKVSPVGEES